MTELRDDPMSDRPRDLAERVDAWLDGDPRPRRSDRRPGRPRRPRDRGRAPSAASSSSRRRGCGRGVAGARGVRRRPRARWSRPLGAPERSHAHAEDEREPVGRAARPAGAARHLHQRGRAHPHDRLAHAGDGYPLGQRQLAARILGRGGDAACSSARRAAQGRPWVVPARDGADQRPHVAAWRSEESVGDRRGRPGSYSCESARAVSRRHDDAGRRSSRVRGGDGPLRLMAEPGERPRDGRGPRAPASPGYADAHVQRGRRRHLVRPRRIPRRER